MQARQAARADALFRPAKTILVPGMYFLGLSLWIGGGGVARARVSRVRRARRRRAK